MSVALQLDQIEYMIAMTERASWFQIQHVAKGSTMAKIAAEVSFQHGLSMDDLRGPSRVRHIAWPRQDAMSMMYAAGFTLNQIGRYFGSRDHSTVAHGISASRARQ